MVLVIVILISMIPPQAVAAAAENHSQTEVPKTYADTKESTGTIVEFLDDRSGVVLAESLQDGEELEGDANFLPVDQSTENSTPSIQRGNGTIIQSVTTDFTYSVLNGTYCQITGYIGEAAAISIPSEIDGYIVQSIAGSTFKDNTTLTTVVFPATIETIGTYLFSGCTALVDVRLNEGLTKISDYTFNGCTSLESITLPSSISHIGMYAFSGCSGLTEVNLPEGLTTISHWAFKGCTSLVSVALPDSVETMGHGVFGNCTKLNEINFPLNWKTCTASDTWNSSYAHDTTGFIFSGCSSLKKIEIPEGVTAIPAYAFRGCTYLEEVILPESLTSIGSYAFYGCTNLKSVNLVEGITEIPAYCFYNCTGMRYLTLPDTLESVGDYAFYNCKGLRSISMGSGLKTIGRYAFYSCQGLVSLFMGSNIETISEYAFAECINIRSITLPTKLVTIGKAAFANCVKVSDLNVPNSVTSIADNAFSGLTNLIFYCSMNSYAATYAIDHNIPIVDTEESTDDSRYIDREKSYYRVNGDGVSASGYLAMVAKYDFLDSATVTNIKLTFNIPGAVELEESTLTVDGVLCTNYTFVNNVLTVPVANTSGTVRFLLKPLNYDRVTAYCKVSFHDGTSNRTEIVGTIYAEIPILSITAPEQTSSTSVKVTGVTIPNSNVTLYVNGSEYTTVKANKVGDYSGIIRFESPSNGKRYTIRAKVVDPTGAAVTAEATIIYRESVPVLTQFIMEYGGKTYNLHELVGTKPSITWASSYRYMFTVRFKNIEGVSSVYIVSTRNNVKKYMQAQWNEEAQAFIAEGFFDNNSSYVPGIISVEYIRSNGTVSFADGYDFTSDETYNNLPQSWKDAEVIVNEDTDDKSDIIVDYPENTSEENDYALRYVTETYTRTDGYSEADAISDGYTKITDDYGKTVYVRQSMDSNTITLTTLEFTELNDAIKVSDITIDLLTGILDDNGDKIFEKAGDTIDILGWIDTSIGTIVDIADIDRIQKEIRNSNMSAEEKERALAQTYITQTVNMASFFMKGALFVAGTLTLSGPWGLVATAALILTGEIVDAWDDYFMERLLGMSFTWAIDPSGYVYDTETGLPILEATVTAYWTPYDESDTEYWKEKPPAEEYGEVWDASEFGQENPLTTDISGWYAWDVPEGWWRVKSERYGYETAWSDWVPVPPPQTAVHIGMTPLDDCGYCGRDAIWTVDEAGTLTVSGSGPMYDYSAEGTAPWSKLASTIVNVVIESGVTAIGEFAFAGCDQLIGVTFCADAPTIGGTAFTGVTATVYYDGSMDGWTSDVLQNYGGTLTWVNSSTSCENGHDYDNGFCTVCDDYEPCEGTGSEADPYRIDNAGNLYWFSSQVNSGNTGMDAILTDDITVNDNVLNPDGTLSGDGSGLRVWTPMGRYDASAEELSYSGFFNGNGKTVSGLYYHDDTVQGAGLFGCLYGGAVENITVADSWFCAMSWVGGIAGVIGGQSSVTGCTNRSSVSGTEHIGGIAGIQAGGRSAMGFLLVDTISGCTNSGVVSGTEMVGGIVGTACCNVTECKNSATVTGKQYVGGITGVNSYTPTNIGWYRYVKVTGCANSGAVYAESFAGGITGYCDSGSYITDCCNMGPVKGGANTTGGIAGLTSGKLTNCHSISASDGGAVAGTYEKPSFLFSGALSAAITNCYYDNIRFAGPAVYVDQKGDADVEGMTTAQFASGEVAYLLGEAWGQCLGTDPCPLPGAAAVYQVLDCDGATVVYSNTNEHKAHTYENGICTGCGAVNAVIDSGWSGSTQWTLTADGTLTVYGTGNMRNYGYGGGQPWLDKGVDIIKVVIEEGVTGVGSGAFRNLTTLKSVNFPATSLIRMGEAAFYGSGLESVEIPVSLWTIQPYTFKNCASLTEVIFNEGNLQKISDGAFYGTGLTELVLPDCLDILDVYAFKGCDKLVSISIGSGLTELREAVFYGTAIPTIVIPEGITKIGSYVFKNCVELETIDLPESLTSVGEASFYACTGLKEITLPDAVTTIGNYAFRKCAAIEELTFGANLVTIGECSFYGCTGLTDLVIPDKVTTIKPYAFKTCEGLTSVVLGSSIQTIGEGTFNTCTGLKTIVFPASLESIGDYCFSGSYNLWNLTFEGNAPSIGTGAFKGLNATAYYPGDNATWTASNMLNYGGKLTWIAV